MSEPVDYMAVQKAGTGRRRWAGSEILSWVVVLLAVATMLAMSSASKSHSPERAERASEFRPGIHILLSGRYLVGLNSVHSLKAVGHDEATLKAMEKSAPGPFEKFRIAIVRGELQGKDAGLKAAHELEAKNKVLARDVQTLGELYDGEPPASLERWQSFHERHGWFADLAASNGKPAGDPLREATLSKATRTMVVGVAMVLIGLGLAVIGLPLLIIGAVLFFRGRLVPAFDRTVELPPDRRTYVQAFAIYLGLMAALGAGFQLYVWLRPNDVGPPMWTRWLILVGIFVLAVLWPLFRGQRWGEWRATLGLHRGRGIFREIFAGVVGYVAGIPLVAIGLGITTILVRFSGLDASHPIFQQISADPWRLAEIFLLASVFAPIAEELLFRGAFFGHWRERYGFWISALGVAFVFAIIHPQGWPALPLLASLAVVLAGIREWRGSIIGCMTAHALNNTAMLIMLSLMLA